MSSSGRSASSRVDSGKPSSHAAPLPASRAMGSGRDGAMSASSPRFLKALVLPTASEEARRQPAALAEGLQLRGRRGLVARVHAVGDDLEAVGRQAEVLGQLRAGELGDGDERLGRPRPGVRPSAGSRRGGPGRTAPTAPGGWRRGAWPPAVPGHSAGTEKEVAWNRSGPSRAQRGGERRLLEWREEARRAAVQGDARGEGAQARRAVPRAR